MSQAGYGPGLQHALDRCFPACERAGIKLITKNTEVLCLSTNQRQCILQVSGNTLQQVEKFKYLGMRYLRVTEGGARRLMHGLLKLTQFCVSFIAM